jgi:hypothetical protein
MLRVGDSCKIKQGTTSFELPENWSNKVALVEIYKDGTCRIMHVRNMGCYSTGLLTDLEEIK